MVEKCMTGRDTSDDETDAIATYTRGEIHPVSDQHKAKQDAAAAARRYLNDARKGRARTAIRRVTFRIKLPRSIMRAARRLAKSDGVSLNQWIGAAVAGKVAAVEAAVAFSGRSQGQIRVVGDLITPVNPDWNVGEDL
jgi:predicted HicB family RNase H-like nuclease